MGNHKACHCCGRIHKLPPLGPGEAAECTRCGSVIDRPGRGARSAGRTAAAGALVLFFQPQC
jgi:paraquat-inducible protein A